MYPFLKQEIFRLVHDCAEELNVDAYAIGGYVRDFFLERESKDIDVVTIGKGIDLASRVHKKLGEGAHLSTFKTFGTAQVKYNVLPSTH
jgi:poly(A) polymerase